MIEGILINGIPIKGIVMVFTIPVKSCSQSLELLAGSLYFQPSSLVWICKFRLAL